MMMERTEQIVKCSYSNVYNKGQEIVFL